MTQNKSYKIEIIVALIGLIGVVGAALIANWDKIIAPDEKRENASVAKIDQLFFQLDSINVDKVRQGATGLSLYVNDPKYNDLIFMRLKSHLSLLRAPHDLKIEAEQNYGIYREEAEKNAKRKEGLYIEPLQKLINNFEKEKRKTLFQTILNNRSLIFGRITAADELCAIEGNGSYWNTLLEDPDPYFRELTVYAIRDRSQDYTEDVLIAALKKPDIRTLAIYALHHKQSKKAVPHLIDIIEHDSNEWSRLAAYEALEEIAPEKVRHIPRPPKPALPKLPPLFGESLEQK